MYSTQLLSLVQEGCEFLFREAEDGRLDLRDAYVYYLDADMYLPPQVEGELPGTPLHFEELEWNKEFTGDTIKGKPAWKKARCPGCGVSV